MDNTMVSISFAVIGLLLTFQGTQAYPLNITNNHNSTDTLSLNNYVHLTYAKALRNDLININKSIEHLIKQLDYWVFSEIVKISNNSLDIEKLGILENSLRILQQKITELSSLLSKKNYNLNEIYFESKDLQIDLNNLQGEFNNTVTKEYQLVNDYLDSNRMVDIFYNLTEQKSYLDMQILEKRENQFAEDCIRAAKNGSIYEASLLINLITNSSKIEYIVKQLSIGNAFKLAEAIRNTSKRFLFHKATYKAVYFVIEEVDNRIDFIIRLVKNIKEAIIDQPKTPKSLRTEAIEFHNDLSSQLQSLFYSKFDLYGSQNCDEIDLRLIDAIIMADYALASKIFYNIHTDWGSDLDKIQCSLNHLLSGAPLLDTKALKYGLFLKYFIDNLRKTNESINNFQHLVDHLPPLVNRMVFSEKVCIINIGSGYHLGSSSSSHDNIKYSIYTQNIENSIPVAIWKLTHVENDIFIIENLGVPDTYLDTDLSNEDLPGEHAVYGWHKPTNIGRWKFELTSNLGHVYIKNLARNELLYTSSETDNFAVTKPAEFPACDHYQWDIKTYDS